MKRFWKVRSADASIYVQRQSLSVPYRTRRTLAYVYPSWPCP